MLVPVLVVAGGKWCDPPASLCFILGRSSGPASPGATDRRYEAPRPGGAGIWRRNAPATRRWRDTAWTRVNCCSSLRGHRNSSVASQILKQLLLLANIILYSYKSPVELHTKAIRKYVKILQSQRRPLIGVPISHLLGHSVTRSLSHSVTIFNIDTN